MLPMKLAASPLALRRDEKRPGGAVPAPWPYLVVPSRGAGRACSPRSPGGRSPEAFGGREPRSDRFQQHRACGPRPDRERLFRENELVAFDRAVGIERDLELERRAGVIAPDLDRV